MTAPREPLYTPELLALAVSLAECPLDPALPLTGEARSPTCGSAVTVGCALGDDGRVERIGLRASACAIGQSAAALFARSALGRDEEQLRAARAALAGWLSGRSGEPDWPGIAALERARRYPARHGAIVLAWDAALAALSKASARG